MAEIDTEKKSLQNISYHLSQISKHLRDLLIMMKTYN